VRICPSRHETYCCGRVPERNDVLTQVVAKYGLEKVAAQRDVDALLKGRAI
jgi:hypothetical protein